MATIHAICISKEKGTPKMSVRQAELVAGHGIKGDAHAGSQHRQVSLLAYEKIEAFRAKAPPRNADTNAADVYTPDVNNAGVNTADANCTSANSTDVNGVGTDADNAPEANGANVDADNTPNVDSPDVDADNSIDMNGVGVIDGAFGENLIIRGIDLNALPIGTLLRSGTVLLELTQKGKECHNHCQIFHRMGDCIMPREGVFAKVLQGGIIDKGDEIAVL